MVEWPRGEAAACKAAYTGSNPVSTSRYPATPRAIGAVVARFLDTEEVTGSNPVSPTSTKRPLNCGNARSGAFCFPRHVGYDCGRNRLQVVLSAYECDQEEVEHPGDLDAQSGCRPRDVLEWSLPSCPKRPLRQDRPGHLPRGRRSRGGLGPDRGGDPAKRRNHLSCFGIGPLRPDRHDPYRAGRRDPARISHPGRQLGHRVAPV